MPASRLRPMLVYAYGGAYASSGDQAWWSSRPHSAGTTCDVEVVADDRKGGNYVFDERSSGRSALAGSHLGAFRLRSGDRRSRFKLGDDAPSTNDRVVQRNAGLPRSQSLPSSNQNIWLVTPERGDRDRADSIVEAQHEVTGVEHNTELRPVDGGEIVTKPDQVVGADVGSRFDLDRD